MNCLIDFRLDILSSAYTGSDEINKMKFSHCGGVLTKSEVQLNSRLYNMARVEVYFRSV